MRLELERLYNQDKKARRAFTGVFKRFGKKRGYKGYIATTILLVDIKIDDLVVTDHAWMNVGKRFDAAMLAPGDVVRFDARVDLYKKGYKGYREDREHDDYGDDDHEEAGASYSSFDYKLCFPTKIEKIGHDSTFENDESDKIKQEIEKHNSDLHERRKNYVLNPPRLEGAERTERITGACEKPEKKQLVLDFFIGQQPE